MLEWLQNTDYALWVQQSWGWPLALTFHAFGNGMVVGTMIIVALRLLGVFKTIPIPSLRFLVPVIWVGVVIQVVSGFTLFLTKPGRYLADGMFEFKLGFVVLGILFTLYFQRLLGRQAAQWQAAGRATSFGMQVACVTVLCWAGVLVMGRLTAYLGQLYHVPGTESQFWPHMIILGLVLAFAVVIVGGAFLATRALNNIVEKAGR